METEKSVYPPAVADLVEKLQTPAEVKIAVDQTESDLKKAEAENDTIHLNRILDLQEMLEALKQRKEKLAHKQAA